MHYRVQAQRVASEIVEREVVILDQIAGTYYSLAGSGAEIWELLVRGASVGGIVEALVTRFDATESVVADAVQSLVAEFVKDELLETLDAPPPVSPVPPAPPARAAWEPPRLERFTDLQSLLLLDPIHDADVTRGGWPHQARDKADGEP